MQILQTIKKPFNYMMQTQSFTDKNLFVPKYFRSNSLLYVRMQKF